MRNKSIYQLDALTELLKNSQKGSIGLCHGVFDLLHIGHIKYFQEAKSLCDFLVVSITPDQYVNKGPGRPKFSENLRAEAIAALDCIDCVVINLWPTAVEIIEQVKPDFYIKGPDYKNLHNDTTGNIFDEKKSVESFNGKLVFTNDDLYSSSSLINEFNKNQYSKEELQWWDTERKKIDFQEVLESFEAIKKLKICVIGENISDVYSRYRPLGRSSKGSSLVFEKGSSKKYDGGALAVAKNLSALHHDVTLITDNIPKITNHKININSLEIGTGIVKERIIDSHTSEKVIEFYNDNFKIVWNKSAKENFYKIIKKEKYDIIFCFDFGHGFFTDEIIKEIEKINSYLILNVQTNAGNRGYNYPTKWNKADVLSMTAEELSLTLQDESNCIEAKVKKLKNNRKFKKILVTRGSAGSIIFDGEKQIATPAFATHVKDRVGAGDTFLVATAGHFFNNTLNSSAIGLIGNLAGAQNLGHDANKELLNITYLIKSIEHTLK